ncbi:tyrosine-protein phosphatase [Ammoniphilus sp. YIM 78166]|uniref:tyrosine-protein phosphatase n=1 Tax=Ammoniphilus sp. YIM 78166 TaxID=1644106 RepID=UPI001070096D|nr:CpsB/CapC family capsule biosynthesis tyrosine phosphatase [Ammoniphilus sp. YIM 78166]
MIDIHSHILFGLDDGAQTPEDTLSMARQAVSDGIRTIVATPHHKDGTYTNPPERILARCQEVQALVKEQGIDLTILPSMELRVNGSEVEDLKQELILTYNQGQRYILLELPRDHVPRYMESLVFNLQMQGIIPIIPHPERNKEISENINLLYRLVKQGAMAQLTAASVVGKFGKKIQRLSQDMIKHHMVHFIASDAHNTGSRGVILSEAYNELSKRFGADYVDLYCEYAEKVVAGKDCELIPVQKYKKKWFGIF